MRTKLLALELVAVCTLAGCHPPARSVTYTPMAIYGAACAAQRGANALQAKPTEIRIAVETDFASDGKGTIHTVTSIAGRAENQRAGTAQITMTFAEVAALKCDQKQPTPRMWVNADGELTGSPPSNE